jgi:hypothetical protein
MFLRSLLSPAFPPPEFPYCSSPRYLWYNARHYGTWTGNGRLRDGRPGHRTLRASGGVPRYTGKPTRKEITIYDGM